MTVGLGVTLKSCYRARVLYLGHPDRALAKELHAQGVSLRKISAELAVKGHLTAHGRPYVATAVQSIPR